MTVLATKSTLSASVSLRHVAASRRRGVVGVAERVTHQPRAALQDLRGAVHQVFPCILRRRASCIHILGS